jgi:hypothetical protein
MTELQVMGWRHSAMDGVAHSLGSGIIQGKTTLASSPLADGGARQYTSGTYLNGMSAAL